MRGGRICPLSCALVLLVGLAAGAAPALGTAAEGAAEKQRKALERVISVEFSEQALPAVLNQLSEQTKLKFVLDRAALANMNGNDPDLPVSVKLTDAKVRSVLRSILTQYNLSYVQIDDTILVTTEEVAFVRQLRQRVRVACDEAPLHTALKQLALDTGANLVLDPRLPKETKEAAVTLHLDEAPLDTAVRLMAEMADLKAVRVSNVLFVTTPERAEKMRAEPEPTAAASEDGRPPAPTVAVRAAALPVAIPAPPAPAVAPKAE